MTTDVENMTFGPVQMLIVGFEDGEFKGEIRDELARLRDADVIRLIDLLAVRKHEDGQVEVLQQSDLDQDEAMTFGAIVGALVGIGAGGDDDVENAAIAGAVELADGHVFDEGDVWYVTDAIEPGQTAAIALLEHRWAIPLRDAIRRAGGVNLADEWIHPRDLAAVGAAAAAGRAG